MSEREKTMAAEIAALPPELQDKFVLMAQGAALALDLLAVKDAADQGPQTGQEKELRDAG